MVADKNRIPFSKSRMRAIAKFCRTQHDIAHEHDGVHYANLVVGVRALNQQVGVLATHEPNHDADTVEKESVLNENSPYSRPASLPCVRPYHCTTAELSVESSSDRRRNPEAFTRRR